jgi:hypothetical protein
MRRPYLEYGRKQRKQGGKATLADLLQILEGILYTTEPTMEAGSLTSLSTDLQSEPRVTMNKQEDE